MREKPTPCMDMGISLSFASMTAASAASLAMVSHAAGTFMTTWSVYTMTHAHPGVPVDPHHPLKSQPLALRSVSKMPSRSQVPRRRNLLREPRHHPWSTSNLPMLRFITKVKRDSKRPWSNCMILRVQMPWQTWEMRMNASRLWLRLFRKSLRFLPWAVPLATAPWAEWVVALTLRIIVSVTSTLSLACDKYG